MFTTPSIKTKVMAHVDTLIKNAQKAHDDEVKDLEQEFEASKVACLEKHVDSIICRFK